MEVERPEDVGVAARERRKELGWTQQEVASRAGTSRQWVNAFEAGKSRAELGLVLRVLGVLGLMIDLSVSSPRSGMGPVDLDAVLAAYLRKPR
jgi:HTH-type transcriptional regulator/antitoxin HipB